MENGREVKKSYCIMSVAYIVIGTVLLLWPDISVHTFCFVFGVGMIILGGAHLIMYFTKDRLQNIMQPDLVIGVVCTATGCYILLKMEYMLEIIPFAMGIVALLGGIVKIQSSIDLRRLRASKWFIMLIWAVILLAAGTLLIVDPFDEQQNMVVILIGITLLLDGIGNLVSIFWTGILFRKLKKVSSSEFSVAKREEKDDIIDAETVPVGDEDKKKSKIVGKHVFFRKKSEKHAQEEHSESVTAESVTAEEPEQENTDFCEVIVPEMETVAVEDTKVTESEEETDAEKE